VLAIHFWFIVVSGQSEESIMMTIFISRILSQRLTNLFLYKKLRLEEYTCFSSQFLLFVLVKAISQ